MQSQKTGKIPPSNIFLIIDNDDEWIALDKFESIVEHGGEGKTELNFKIGVKLSDYMHPGHYEGDLMLVSTVPNGPEPSTIHIPLELDISAEISHAITNNKVYFHIGNPIKEKGLEAIISGRVDTDCPVSLLLSVEEDTLNGLRFIQTFSSIRRSDEPDPIPVIWALKENGQEGFRMPDFGESEGREIGWHLQRTPGYCEYDLKCAINPLSFQAPGEYGLKIEVSMVPKL